MQILAEDWEGNTNLVPTGLEDVALLLTGMTESSFAGFLQQLL